MRVGFHAVAGRSRAQFLRRSASQVERCRMTQPKSAISKPISWCNLSLSSQLNRRISSRSAFISLMAVERSKGCGWSLLFQLIIVLRICIRFVIKEPRGCIAIDFTISLAGFPCAPLCAPLRHHSPEIASAMDETPAGAGFRPAKEHAPPPMS